MLFNFEKGGQMSNIINMSKLFKENTNLHVSPAAVKEYISRIIDGVEDNVPEIEKITKKHGRKTIYEEDIIEFFGIVGNSVLND